MTTRRDVYVAMGIAVVAAVLLTVAIGTMVTLGLRTGEKVRGEGARVAPPASSPLLPADRIPVLCYHYVRGPGGPLHIARVFGYVVLSLPLLDASELWNVSRSGFERQMYYLYTRGYHTVTLDELHEWQMGRRELPAKSVVITFDDGDESAYEYAYPVLKQYGLRATLFVLTSRVGTNWSGIRCLDWDRLREMQRSGVFNIESHTHDLHFKIDAERGMTPVFLARSAGFDPDSDKPWDTALFDDLMESRLAIQRHIGRTPQFLAWPFGFGNPAVDQIAYEAGFIRTCSLSAAPTTRVAPGDRMLLADTKHYEIPRYTITARTSLRVFRRMLDGTYLPQN